MSGKLVVYSAIFGGKDSYREPPDGDYDVVLFTDRPPESTRRAMVFEVPSGEHPRRTARLYKTTPHILFPHADYTLWMDGLIEVREIDPMKACLEHLADADVAAHHNKESSCIYDAAHICIRGKVDDPTVINRQMARYRAEGYPEGFGLVETGIVMRRNNPDVTRFNEMWKSEILKGSVRDQLSFNYVAWKTGIRLKYIPGNLTRTSTGTGFCVSHHLHRL